MYIINTIPHGKCFVRYLRTRFCIRNRTSERSERVRFLIHQQLVRKYRKPALFMKYSLYTFQYMVIHGYTWQYMVIHSKTWQYIVVHVWLYMVVHGNTWQYMVIHSNPWQYMAYTWEYMVMAIHGNTWL